MARPDVAAPTEALPRMSYKHPWIDRLLGRYTTEWTTPTGERVEHRSLRRIRDDEGDWPSWTSVRRLPTVLRTARQIRRAPILPNPVPFLVFDAIDHLDRIVRPGMRVLEVGGGNSTLWFLAKGAVVTTIEDSADWAADIERHVAARMPADAAGRLDMHVLRGEAAFALIRDQPDHAFDVVLIDGANAVTRRNTCVALARPKVTPGGWLVLDNSDVAVNWAGADLMADRERRRFTGYGPMQLVVSQTSMWRM